MTAATMVLAVALAGVTPRAAFDSLKSLAGEWEGAAGIKKEAADKKPEAPPQTVTYRVVSNGNVVMETLFGGTSHEMITMYHLDGEDLVLTHYCAAGNQPKMKLDTEKSTDRDLRFSFAGGTNITAEGFHMHEGRLMLRDADHIESEWAGQQGGKPGHTAGFKLTRKK
jgi:hypothetical protein